MKHLYACLCMCLMDESQPQSWNPSSPLSSPGAEETAGGKDRSQSQLWKHCGQCQQDAQPAQPLFVNGVEVGVCIITVLRSEQQTCNKLAVKLNQILDMQRVLLFVLRTNEIFRSACVYSLCENWSSCLHDEMIESSCYKSP